MTGELTAQGLIDLRKATFVGVPVVTFSFPGSNTRRLSIEGSPLQSSLGIFRDRLLDIGEIDYRLSDPRGGLQAVTTSFRVSDYDGDILSIVNRYGVSALRGSAIVSSLATKSDPADWPLLLTGILDGIEPAGNKQWSIIARVDDRPLVDGTFRVPRLSSIDYTLAPTSVLERSMPVAVGRFDSRDGTVAGSTGSVPLLRLGESDGTGGFAYRYLVMAAYASHVQRVAVAGTALATTAWLRRWVRRNGIDTTEVWLATDPGETAVVTAEISGLCEDVPGSSVYTRALGTGQPITNIVRGLRWLLRNYVWSAYRTGAYASDPSAFGTATWDAAETWAEQKRFRASYYLNGQRPIDLFNAFCQWAWVRAGWAPDGTLNLYPITDVDAPYYDDTRWIRYALKGAENAFLPSLPRDRMTHQIRSASWLVPANSASRSVVSVRDSRVTGNVVSEINHPLGVARQEFQDGYPGPANLLLALNASRPGLQGNAVYLANGSPLYRWRDINWSPASAAFDFPNGYRTNATMTATAGNEPTWVSGGLNGHPFVRFDGVNDWMSHGVVFSPGSVITVWIVFRLLAASLNDALVYQNHGLVVGDGSLWGLHVRTSGGLYYLQAHSYDGVSFNVSEAEIPLNTWIVARFRNMNSFNCLSINNWDEVKTASGSISGSGAVRIGTNHTASNFINADIASLYIWQDSDLARQGNTSGDSVPGLGANFDIYQSLKDRYGL